ncbi:MAG: peroxidase-related enzyme [Planctomycetota bacterium]|jgi:uncharacterized peroxidase-related enzyme
MAWIRTIDESEATGPLADLYARAGNPDGTVDNVMMIHSLNPESLRTHFEMYAAAMHRPSPLSRAEREMVATVVSRLNGCAYCLAHHHAGLVRLLPDDRRAAADALRDGREAALSPRERALVTYASKLTTSPQAMEPGDVENLRGAGLDDRAILDLAQCVGYFNYVNRIVTGLGVALGAGEGPPGQWPE